MRKRAQMTTTCYRCNNAKDLRPWGPGRALICANCAGSDDELFAIARMYSQQDRGKRKADAFEKLRKDNPQLHFIEAPTDFILRLLEETEPLGPCDCPRCAAERSEESKHDK